MKATNLTFLACSSFRLILAYLPWTNHLKDDHLLSSPLTSFSRLREGLFLFQSSINPYNGGVFRHSPLLLSMFSTILPLRSYSVPVLWTLWDILSAWLMLKIWNNRKGTQNENRGWLVVATYMLNPYLVFPNLARSSSSIDNLTLLIALYSALSGRKSNSIVFLALATHLSVTNVLLTLPIAMILSPLSPANVNSSASQKLLPNWKSLISPFLEYIFYMIFLAAVSTLVIGDFSWIGPTWGAAVSLPDLTPNVGLWWYFFTEMFDHFRPFFLVVFSVNMLIYVVPICIKFQHDPFYATFLLIGIIGMFKPYPTLADPGLFLSMISLFPEIYSYLNTPIITILLHLHASLLLPLFNRLWLADGTGNANFFYASTLVFAMANGSAITDCIWAGLRVVLGEGVNGWTVVQVYHERVQEKEVGFNSPGAVQSES